MTVIDNDIRFGLRRAQSLVANAMCHTAVYRVLHAIRWYECWMLNGIHNGKMTRRHIARLMSIEHPMFFTLFGPVDGNITIKWEPGLTAEKLHIGGLNVV